VLIGTIDVNAQRILNAVCRITSEVKRQLITAAGAGRNGLLYSAVRGRISVSSQIKILGAVLGVDAKSSRLVPRQAATNNSPSCHGRRTHGERHLIVAGRPVTVWTKCAVLKAAVDKNVRLSRCC